MTSKQKNMFLEMLVWKAGPQDVIYEMFLLCLMAGNLIVYR